ncbi:hypothetical protein [Salmonella phage SD-15_S21]|nr:hypothetical protein [Salmonella phage SD-15_S21]
MRKIQWLISLLFLNWKHWLNLCGNMPTISA